MPDRKIRLLVVDDSLYMRMAIRAMVGTHPEIVVVGEAEDGLQAIDMALRLAPDVITMDVSMPGLDGLVATRRIMAEAPTAIIMLSSLTEKGAATTFRALEAGAVDYLPKSSSAIDVDLVTVAEQLAARIRFWGSPRPGNSRSVAAAVLPTLPAGTDLLVIAGGSGSQILVRTLLEALAPLPFPVLVAQAMLAKFTGPFVDYLGRTIGHPTREGTHGCTLAPGIVVVMPGGRQGTVSRNAEGAFSLALERAGAVGAADADLLVSAIQAALRPALIVLSGEACSLERLSASLAGKDGALWVQSPATCVTEALPRAALAMDVPAHVLEPVELVAALRATPERSAA